VSDDAALNFLRSGLVLPADGNWPDDLRTTTEAVHSAPEPRTEPEPASVAHEPCEPGPRPKGARTAIAVCPTPGCPCQTWNGPCAECKRSAGRKRNATAHQRAYREKAWQDTRRTYLRAHPLCECAECAAVPGPLRPAATIVDHIDGLGPLGPRAHDWSNLRAMTTAHHNRRTMRDQGNGT
jgi:5-methylcytosine-specific restriction enzyme A